ncbi:RNA polymerase subunit sigma-70 [Yoonia sp.]|uniref:RNA polymerase subunit sigma-70 n=1 Tax=Yoonia sp. TaxID=2212373 RepID=UPI003A4E1F08
MKTTWIATGLAAVLALTAGAAVAQGHRDRPDLAAMDTDGDGAVSLEEMTAYAQSRTAERVARMFARLDADGDGVITQAEFEAAKDRRGDRPGRPAPRD